jgi:hypothetical protein
MLPDAVHSSAGELDEVHAVVQMDAGYWVDLGPERGASRDVSSIADHFRPC